MKLLYSAFYHKFSNKLLPVFFMQKKKVREKSRECHNHLCFIKNSVFHK